MAGRTQGTILVFARPAHHRIVKTLQIFRSRTFPYGGPTGAAHELDGLSNALTGVWHALEGVRERLRPPRTTAKKGRR